MTLFAIMQNFISAEWSREIIIGLFVGIVGGAVLAIFGVYFRTLKKLLIIKKLKTAIDKSGDWVENQLKDEHFQNAEVFDGKENIPLEAMHGSFIIHGDAGSGKSMILKKHYLHERARDRRALIYFFQADGINALSDKIFDGIDSDMRECGFDRLIFYFDGIDETDKADESFFLAVTARFAKYAPQFRISCRDKFYSRLVSGILQQDRKLFNAFYNTVKWSKRSLFGYVYTVVKAKQIPVSVKRAVLDVFKDLPESDYAKIDHSPLLCKMLAEILVCDCNYKIDDNRYAFYLSFFTKAVLPSVPNKQAALSAFAAEVFGAYDGKAPLRYDPTFDRILKISFADSSVAIFKHDTFREFFIAYHYLDCIDSADGSTAAVLSCAYTNDVADFTTAGMLLLDSGQTADKLMNIYALTERGAKRSADALRKAVDALPPERYFRLKYEIIFRLGRLRYKTAARKNKVIAFLDRVYKNDDHFPKLGGTGGNAYWRAVLKRCCAISSSFLGGYATELDYVTKMLDWRAEYDAQYDLANRSHTLYFYGDIVNDNDIFGYIDTAADVRCDKALHKRISRLNELYDCDDVAAMTDAQRRKYYFRLFDIATIYNFIRSRLHAPDLLCLTDNDAATIRNFKTDFTDAADVGSKRADLLRDIKAHAVDLLDSAKL